MSPVARGLVSALGWGTSDFVARLSGRALGPANALLGMFVFGTLGLSAWIAIARTPLRLPADGLIWVAASGLGVMAATLLLYTALSRGPVAVAAPVSSSYPAFVALAAPLLGIYPSPVQWLAMATTLAGVWIVAHSGRRSERAGDGVSLTVVLALGAAVLIAVSVLAAREAAVIYGALMALWLSRLVSLACLIVLIVASRTQPRLPLRWWPALALQGVLDTGAFLTLLYGSAGSGAALAPVASAPFALVTVVLARIFLREPIPALQWGGVAVVSVSVGVLAYSG
jgi:drug/metabolite transporter (DMT)-like permease